MKNTKALSLLIFILTALSQAPADALAATKTCQKGDNSEQRVAKYFARLKRTKMNTDSATNAEIGGIQFKKESPALLWAFRELVAESENDPINLQRKYKVNPNCYNVVCAVDKIFGNKIGRQMVYLQANFDFNTSKLLFNNATSFYANELNSIIAAVHLVPDRLLPLGRSQQLTKFMRGYTSDEYGSQEESVVLANARMEFFDSWTYSSAYERIFTVVHEIAHNLSDRDYPNEYSYSVLSREYQHLDSSTEWLALSGWRTKPYPISKLHREQFFSDYASTDPGEDFAESVAAYIMRPQRLKNLHLDKYNFIKFFVFGNQEFIPGACDNATVLATITEKYSKSLRLKSESEISDLANQCVASKYYAFDSRDTFNCIDHKMITLILQRDYNLKTKLIPIELINPMTEGFSVHFPQVYAQVLAFAETSIEFSLYNAANVNKALDKGIKEYLEFKITNSEPILQKTWSKIKNILFDIDVE